MPHHELLALLTRSRAVHQRYLFEADGETLRDELVVGGIGVRREREEPGGQAPNDQCQDSQYEQVPDDRAVDHAGRVPGRLAAMYAPERPASALPRWMPTPSMLGILVAGVVLAFVAVARGPVDADYFWHLRTGRLILESGLPATDPYSFTYDGPWVLHEWLGEVERRLEVKLREPETEGKKTP